MTPRGKKRNVDGDGSVKKYNSNGSSGNERAAQAGAKKSTSPVKQTQTMSRETITHLHRGMKRAMMTEGGRKGSEQYMLDIVHWTKTAVE